MDRVARMHAYRVAMHTSRRLARRFPLWRPAMITQHELIRRQRDRLADFMRIKSFRQCRRHRTCSNLR